PVAVVEEAATRGLNRVLYLLLGAPREALRQLGSELPALVARPPVVLQQASSARGFGGGFRSGRNGHCPNSASREQSDPPRNDRYSSLHRKTSTAEGALSGLRAPEHSEVFPAEQNGKRGRS